MAGTPKSDSSGGITRFLNLVERVGNKLPDPALLFVFALGAIWVVSWLMSGTEFEVPQLGGGTRTQTIANQLTGASLAHFLAHMVETFTGFHPLGVVLVALLGVGVAEESGFINAVLKRLLSFTPKALLTPMLILVAIVSHTAADAGYVLVIPLGGVLFYAAGRHPLAGIAAAFAGVSGGFGANFVPSGIDPLLQGITQAGANVTDPTVVVNPLCNWLFTSFSSLLIVLVGWFLTDRIIEPRLANTKIDGDPADMPKMEPLTPAEARGLRWGLVAFFIGCAVLALVSWPEDSELRSKPSTRLVLKSGETIEHSREGRSGRARLTALRRWPTRATRASSRDAVLVLDTGTGIRTYDLSPKRPQGRPGLPRLRHPDSVVIKESRRGGATRLVASSAIGTTETVPPSLTSFAAPIMRMIVPLIFLLFLIPRHRPRRTSRGPSDHRDVIKGMSRSMSTMGYYLVMAFFAALFIKAFSDSNVGAWLAVRGAEGIERAGLPAWVTIVGIILLCGTVNLVVGSASAKWALLAPIFVPMLMALGISPEFTQAAYRVGDSTTNIITPLMPYFPLVVAFCQRYVKNTGIGTLISLMLPFSISFLVIWTAFLILYWKLGIPLGIDASYVYSVK
ncbi:MAG: AbgT family transporter [Planctomycetota bacterium]